MRVSPELQSPTRNAYPPNYLGRASAMGALFALFLVVSGPRAADDNEVKRTWDAAEVAVERSGVRVVGRMDDPRVQAGLTKLRVGRAIPTVIYMHGCDGLRRSTSVSRALVRRGFAVIAPDSFARSGRVAMCGRGGEAKRRMRHEEIRFAARQALTLAWVDPNNLVLEEATPLALEGWVGFVTLPRICVRNVVGPRYIVVFRVQKSYPSDVLGNHGVVRWLTCPPSRSCLATRSGAPWKVSCAAIPRRSRWRCARA